MALYNVQNPFEKAMQAQNSTGNAYGAMMKDIPANRPPEKSVGGAMMTGLSGAGTMAAIAGTESGAAALTTLGVGTGPMGLLLGAGLGIGAYLFS